MRRSLVIALALLATIPAAVSAEIKGIPEPGHGWADCGNQIPATWSIRAKNTACSTARKVAKKSFVKMGRSMSWDATRARGFSCARYVSHYDGSVYRCTKSTKEVRFYIGG